LASGNPIYRRTIAVYLLAIVAPALVLLYFGVESFRRQRQAVESLLRSNLRLSGERLAGELERRTTELARECLRSNELEDVQRRPIAQYFFLIDGGRVVYPPLRTPPPLTLDELLAREHGKLRDEFAVRFREAESQEIRQGNLDTALANYRNASGLGVSDSLRALALQRAARCLEKLNRPGESRQVYQVLAEKYGNLTDLSHRPFAVVAALALGPTAAQKKVLWQAITGGRWQLSAEQMDYFAALLGEQPASADGTYAQHMHFARELEEQFRHSGPLQPDLVSPFAFATHQTFYRLTASGRLLGFAVDTSWVRDQLLPQCRNDLKMAEAVHLIKKGDPAHDRVSFPSLFPFWELAVQAPSGSPGGDGLLVQAAITALVLCLLIMGVVLLLRDLARDARINQLRADFVGAVSHELKTPISVIRLYGETLLDDDDFTAAQRREFYQIITRESDRLTQLIEKVLAFSKIDRGDKQYHLKPADLAPVISRTVETYEQYLTRRGFSVETRLAAQLPPVSFDADAVSQALVNLLDNAAKYSGESRSIAVRSYAANGCAVLEVEDHGIGIPREEQEKIFQRFYRVGNAVAKGGYGLGLYLVRHIMDAHKGKVELESEPQRGSRFRLIFPVAESPVAESGSNA
jgi:signal transduction histidine kinase